MTATHGGAESVRWRADLERVRLGAWITYRYGVYEETPAWRPSVRWAEWSAQRGVRSRNRRQVAARWTVEERP